MNWVVSPVRSKGKRINAETNRGYAVIVETASYHHGTCYFADVDVPDDNGQMITETFVFGNLEDAKRWCKSKIED